MKLSIDCLHPLFAERVQKTLRNLQGAIPYNLFTYGKLIGACTQEGINMCNELKLSKQLKIDKLRESSQLGDFCAQFGLPNSELHAYLSQKEKCDTFASIAKDDIDDIKSYQMVAKREKIFLWENSEIQRKDEPWKIFQRTGSTEFQHFSGYNTSANVYNFSKMIVNPIISIEDWGIS
ncbi:hypothetical protein H5410_059745 [Solanum commersonii]|uniref:Uncharacterized protein n=1 Tax=Solanum commersonii TaxID=4109 RepID=A0A9J5W374_SOLCO|nr:hypothetical protein H5410_059745 [Solanum commersonii]